MSDQAEGLHEDVGEDVGTVLVIIPTYNEADNVEAIVGRVRAAVPYADVLLADDNSPDGTGKIADRMSDDDPHVHVLHRAGKEGLGRAYIAGFGWGIDHAYDVLVEMDADGSHRPEQLPDLLAALRTADLVIGARWVRGGRVENWSKLRELLSRSANLYARFALGLALRDATAGFRAFRRPTVEAIGYREVVSQGYCFQIDLAMRAVRRGHRVVEVPITFEERTHGVSKMSGSVMLEAFWRVAGWAVAYHGGRLRALIDRRRASRR